MCALQFIHGHDMITIISYSSIFSEGIPYIFFAFLVLMHCTSSLGTKIETVISEETGAEMNCVESANYEQPQGKPRCTPMF